MGLFPPVPFVRSPYNYDVKKASDDSAYVETMPSLTVQSMSEDADLNVMMERFGVTGKFPENPRLPSYGDFAHVSDYRSAIEASRAAYNSFLEFPPDIRASFDNDPQLFLEYVENPANIAQVQKWFPKENVNGDSRSGSVQPALSAESNRQSAQADNQNRAGAAASGGGAGGAAAVGK